MRVKPSRLWAAVCGIYALFIGTFSFLYPYGLDEYVIHGQPLDTALFNTYSVFWLHSPKFGVFFSALVLFIGKWFFVLLNPLAQLAMVFALFYLVYMRLPDFKSYEDMPVFILTALLSVFAVATPSNTLFWIGGATNYSWVFLVFVIFLCLLRGIYEKKPLIKDNWLNCFLILIPAFCLGASNENNAPMALLIFAGVSVLCRYKKIKLPKWYYFALAMVIAGICIMFLSPALMNRWGTSQNHIQKLSLWEQLFIHLVHFHSFIKFNMGIYPLTFLILLICGIDSDKAAFKNKNFLSGLGFFITAFIVFFVLFVTPYVGGRNFYSATVFSIISFLFALEYLKQTYNFKAARYAAMLMLAYAAAFLPLFAMPYVNLYRQSLHRKELIKTFDKKGQNFYALPLYIILSGGAESRNIIFYDDLLSRPDELLRRYKKPVSLIVLLPDEELKMQGSSLLF